MLSKINKQGLLERLSLWDGFLKRKVNLIACGGTAMTLLGIKDSTKDIDLLIPKEREYVYLIETLKQLGYKPVTGSGWTREGDFIFDLFLGKRVHTTELLESPLDKENHFFIHEFNHIYLGALNYYDLIISKLFRATSVDFDDCLSLARTKNDEIDFTRLQNRYRETALYDVSEDRVLKHLDSFMKKLKKKGLYYDR